MHKENRTQLQRRKQVPTPIRPRPQMPIILLLLLGLMGDGLGFGIRFDGRKVGLSHMALPISHDIDNFWYTLLVSSILIKFSCRL